jgi:DNA-binding response OmpR family regulator
VCEAIVLFIDNDPDFLKTRAEFLENAGYRVLEARTLEEARQLLADAHVHLAILDIRMVDDDDERDTSGLTLAKDTAYRSIPKIILTDFPSYQTVREALGSAADGLSPAVDYLARKEGPEVMIAAVDRAFGQHVRLNWDLNIHWGQQQGLSFLYLAGLLQPDLANHILVHRAVELEDLVRRLFYDYRQIRIGRLLWYDRRRFCLSLLAQSRLGATDPRILVCGEQGQLRQELKQIQELAPETVEGTKLDGVIETRHFGAVTYVLPDADVETVQTLRNLFKNGTERSLKRAFNHLLGKVLVAWHQRGQSVEEVDLMSLYRRWVGVEENGLSCRQVERRVESLIQAVRPISAMEVERGDGLVAFHFPNLPSLVCPDPVVAVYTPLKQYGKPVVCRISPGQLTADDVLVDAGQRTWLTDFAHAGQAPQWWDFVCLEAAVRFDLSQAPDLLAWQDFEECLTAPVGLADRLQTQDVVPDLRTSVALIEQIRRQAGSEAGLDPLPYYAGLLAWAVGAMAHYDPAVLHTRAEQMRGAHLLLAAAMLVRQLDETLPASPPGGTLRLDDDGTVWVGDHCVGVLVGQELDLLRLLYEQAGQLVSRRTIVESVFGERYVAGDKDQESRINSLVRRLRVKVEPGPGRPRYVLTIKRSGYRLGTSQEADVEVARSP